MKVKASNALSVPSQMYLLLRSSMLGAKAARMRLLIRLLLPSAAHDQVGVAVRLEILDLGLEAQLDAERARSLLEDARAGACGRCRRSRGRSSGRRAP